jgi:hypothetical protein
MQDRLDTGCYRSGQIRYRVRQIQDRLDTGCRKQRID